MPPGKDRASVASRGGAAPVTGADADRFLEPLAGHHHVALGVSGGSDSTALMVLAADWAERRGGPRLTVLTVDHGLREGSAAEAARVASWAARLGLGHVTLQWSGAKPRSGIQESARAARYGLMTRWCREAGVGALAVAHTLEDQAETVIMRLARGSGLDGLAAMAGASERDGVMLLRPLLALRRDRLRAMLEARGQPWIDDPSNRDERYERVRVRGLLSSLEEAGLGAEAIARSAGRLGAARTTLDAMATRAMTSGVTCYDAGFVTIDLQHLIDTEPEVGIRVLGRCVQAVGGKARAPAREALERLDAALRGTQGRAWTLGGCVIRRRGGEAVICRECGRRAPEPVRLARGCAPLWDGRFRLSAPGQRGSRLLVRALDAAGWEQWADDTGRRPALPAYVGRSLVSVWRGDRLVSVPHMEPPARRAVDAEFCERGLLAGAARQRLIDADVTANLPHRPIIAPRFGDA